MKNMSKPVEKTKKPYERSKRDYESFLFGEDTLTNNLFKKLNKSKYIKTKNLQV